jgi:hypothetical protein
VPDETTDDGSYMLGLVLVGSALALFWFGVGLVVGWAFL